MLSLIVPHYPYDKEIDALLEDCHKRVTGYDELILVVNQGIGFARAVNWGFKMAKGDYLLMLSNDVLFEPNTNLQVLTDPNAVTSPIINNHAQEFYGACFCLPRWVYQKIGGFDEQFEMGFFEDDDYIMRLREANIPMRSIPINATSRGGQTMKFMEVGDLYNINSTKFIQKWGINSSSPKSL